MQGCQRYPQARRRVLIIEQMVCDDSLRRSCDQRTEDVKAEPWLVDDPGDGVVLVGKKPRVFRQHLTGEFLPIGPL